MKTTVIYGPPGTGKTTKLLSLVEEFLEHYDPKEIAYVSFTRKGAYEGRDRAMTKFQYTERDFPFFKTIHSIAFHEIGARKEQMLNWKDYRFFSKQMGMNFLGYYTEDLIHNDDQYLFWETLRRNNTAQAEKMAAGMDRHRCQYVAENYRKFKTEYQKYDFTDLIQQFNDTVPPLPVKVAIVDEAQDLSTLQWSMVFHAFKNVDHLFIAGDDDQAIYQWSGADVSTFHGVAGDRFVLSQGYRLPYRVHQFAIQISAMIGDRVEKHFSPTAEEGSVTFYNDISEVPIKRGGSWLALARNNCYLKKFTKYFDGKGMVYNVKGESSIATADLRLIHLYESVRLKGAGVSKDTAMALRKVCDKNTNYSFPWHYSFPWPQEKKMYYMDFLKAGAREDRAYNLNVSTIHGVKGGEADDVILLLNVTKAITAACDDNIDSELRCIYVACTRARKNLHVVLSNEKNTAYDRIIKGVKL